MYLTTLTEYSLLLDLHTKIYTHIQTHIHAHTKTFVFVKLTKDQRDEGIRKMSELQKELQFKY